MQNYFLIVLCVAGIVLPAKGQKDYDIRLQSGLVPQEAFIHPADKARILREIPEFQDNYFFMLQFDDIPTPSERGRLQSAGVILSNYLPDYAYLAMAPKGVDFGRLGARAVIPLRAQFKLEKGLADGDFPAHALTASGVRLNVYSFEGVEAETLLRHLLQSGFAGARLEEGKVSLTIPTGDLLKLAAIPGVLYIEPEAPPPVPEGMTGRTLQRVNSVSRGPGQGYDGSGVALAIADDGSIDHVDFKGRLTDLTTYNAGNHGDMVAGLAIGAGNIDPTAMGMATGAHLFLYGINGYPHIGNAVQNYQQHGVVVTSTSYSEGCGGYYSQSAQFTDGQVYGQNQLLHCFSAGNSAVESCGAYGGLVAPDGMRYGNITGGIKAAKNVLAVANLYYNDSRHPTSSRGPALDGRIKPDISAHGQGNRTTDSGNTYQAGGGTSAASPSLAGTAALLYHAYRDLNGGATPSSALIKALLLNTADDLGRPGPDYDFGWGRVHAGRALETIQQERHLQGSVAHGLQNTHQIQVPAGARQLRVMVYWHDPAASPLASKALVNDLDLTVVRPNGQTLRPLTLSAAVHIDSITRPAYPGTDRINNVEQVVLDNPSAGTYSVRVKGHLVAQGPQTYSLVYYFLMDDMTVVYPSGGEGFVPGEEETIRWDAFGNTGTFIVEYSIDSMATWHTISGNVPANRRYLNWAVPAVVTGRGFIRVRRGGQSASSPAAFSIIGQPAFSFSYLSDNEALISWQPVNGANAYDVYALGDKYMEVVGSTSNTSIAVPIGLWQGNWFSVRARNSDGATGRRAYAKHYIHKPCDVQITLTLNFDFYPQETRWEIINDQGALMLSGGPYSGQSPLSTLVVEDCLPNGCYYFIIRDSYGDGMCCQYGNGSYELKDAAGNILAAGGAFNSAQVTYFCVEAPPNPLSIHLLNMTPASCHGGSDGSISAAATGGTGTYQFSWSNGVAGSSVGNLAAGIYTLTVTDGQSQVVSTFIVTQPAALSAALTVTDATCTSDANGSISAVASGGTPPYSIAWSNGSPSMQIGNLTPGSYSMTLTDSKGCPTVAEGIVGSSNSLSLALAPDAPSCHGAADGGIASSVGGGSGLYHYNWSAGGDEPAISGLPAGLYSLTVNDGNGCSASATLSLAQPDPLQMQIDASSVSCNGTDDGSAAATAGGGTAPYAFSWSNGASGASTGNLAPGTYFVTVIDHNNCTLAEDFEIADPIPLTLQLAAGVATTYYNGVIDLTVSGGVPPYTYLWSNGAQSEDLYGLTPGVYSVTIADSKGCEASGSAEVEGPPQGGTYCSAQGSNASYEWIQRVVVGPLDNNSGNNGGYGNFTGMSLNLVIGNTYSVALTPGFDSYVFNEHWRLWIDLNGDGDFMDDGEVLFSSPGAPSTVNGTISIPATAIPGPTRMRIGMRHGTYPNSCGNFAYGEVEDYGVFLSSVAALAGNGAAWQAPGSSPIETGETRLEMTVYPNPAIDVVRLKFSGLKSLDGALRIIDVNGRVVYEQIADQVFFQNPEVKIDHLPPGMYNAVFIDDSELIARPFVVHKQTY
jgi:hypothetical protein